jgi:hypothetical protein
MSDAQAALDLHIRSHGRSLKLAAFAAFAGPLDLLTRFAGRGSPQDAKEPR